jgi:hypothetical protein
VQLRDDVVRLRPSARVVRDREQRLDDLGVRVADLRGQDEDGPRGLEPGDLQIVDVHRLAGPAHDARPTRVGEAGPDLVVHRDLVPVRQHDDGGPVGKVRVRRHELREDREDLLRPAEDDRVVRLHDPRATLAQLVELALEAGVDHTDQGADDEDPAERDGQHPDEKAGRAPVAAHRARVERPHEAGPQEVGEGHPLAAQAHHRDHERDREDADGGDEEQARDQGDRAPSHEVVEGVAEPIPPGRHRRSMPFDAARGGSYGTTSKMTFEVARAESIWKE